MNLIQDYVLMTIMKTNLGETFQQKEAYDLQMKQKMLPYPTDEKYFKAVVIKDIHREIFLQRGHT